MDGLILSSVMEDEAPLVQGSPQCEQEIAEAVQTMTDMDAEAHVEKINMWDAYRKKWVEHYEKKIAEVNERADRNIAWHRHFLRMFFNLVPHKGTKTTLYYDGLLSSKLVLKKGTDKINKPKADVLLKIKLRLLEHGEKEYIVTKTTEDVDWDAYKANLSIVDGQVVDKRTGEILEDVPITHVEPEFVVKMKGREDNDDEGNSASES